MPAMTCPACRQSLREGARYCSRCGAECPTPAPPAADAGLRGHPHPLPAPEGSQPWKRGTDLYFRWRHGQDGPVLGAETIYVSLFNAGYPLRDVCVEVRGLDAAGREQFRLERGIAELPPGAGTMMEVPSYEIPGEVHEVIVSLVSAEYAN